MISLEQVQQLEVRIRKVVTAIKTFSEENEKYKCRVVELEAELEKFRCEAVERNTEEKQVEESFQSVFNILDEVDETDSATTAENKIGRSKKLPSKDTEKAELGKTSGDTPDTSKNTAKDDSVEEKNETLDDAKAPVQSEFDIF